MSTLSLQTQMAERRYLYVICSACRGRSLRIAIAASRRSPASRIAAGNVDNGARSWLTQPGRGTATLRRRDRDAVSGAADRRPEPPSSITHRHVVALPLIIPVSSPHGRRLRFSSARSSPPARCRRRAAMSCNSRRASVAAIHQVTRSTRKRAGREAQIELRHRCSELICRLHGLPDDKQRRLALGLIPSCAMVAQATRSGYVPTAPDRVIHDWRDAVRSNGSHRAG